MARRRIKPKLMTPRTISDAVTAAVTRSANPAAAGPASNEDVDEPHRILSVHVVVNRIRQQQKLVPPNPEM
jgi:hypothetical protein